jgi:hypothetical protein
MKEWHVITDKALSNGYKASPIFRNMRKGSLAYKRRVANTKPTMIYSLALWLIIWPPQIERD